MKSSKSPIQAVIFDIDGTLIDSVDLHARAWQDAFVRFDKRVGYKEIRDKIGMGGDKILPQYLTPEEIEEFGDDLVAYRSEHFKAKYITKIRPFPQVRELFETIAGQGKKIAIGSSAQTDQNWITTSN